MAAAAPACSIRMVAPAAAHATDAEGRTFVVSDDDFDLIHVGHIIAGMVVMFADSLVSSWRTSKTSRRTR